MHGHDLGLSVAENYRAFAEDARGRSSLYESLAGAVAGDEAILGFLGSLPARHSCSPATAARRWPWPTGMEPGCNGLDE